MPSTYKVLGQSKPAAATLTDAYTVGAGVNAILSRIVVCNQSATATTFRITIAPLGAGDTPAHALFFDQPIGGNETITIAVGAGLAATDKVRVYNAAATVSFNLLGVELT